ncbi:reverse transcriptase (RNA-dependent DNA polymerase) [Hirsutella rhossiliensis]|uniref:Reverse transcriptase (RNA-dependent DNA polymerase) domain-containing protein n=1 Tax=Hirsutella rhossiliensis TaxID=111463 RepID=A0A9P8SKP8_9HYPO|nr:reverse transcriptase (RNA-dependent DNA polymerase) domain-containing protein [Hirsutella rhossiliensis]KAH0966106.1 reverse transcriptase (RNA-dependent DNA polymerase) domain-containing protein [Hirsutella rhossiliensis]
MRALYGLRRSPLLWQKELTAAFRELGLTQCPDEPCIFQNDWLTVFFFVDDIVFLYRKENEDAADEMVAALKRNPFAHFPQKLLGGIINASVASR